MNKIIALVILVSLGISCNSTKKESSSYYQELYRPQIHFSPETNWMNDPNGLVYIDNEYHLFYQYNPYGNTWGHMSWGHAVSTDLLHWKHLPIALREYQDKQTGDSTMIFSGTAIVDKNNTAGFGANAMIAIFTSHVHKNNQGLIQHQSLAYSNDKGRTWSYYDKNPILDIKRKDFRDPKVFWYEPQQKWVMALVIPDLFTVQFYDSKNLTEWKLTGSFKDTSDTTRIWECPDLYELPIENENKSKWVLSLSGSHPQGPKFVGMQYFVGEFDGSTFQKDSSCHPPLYVEYGKDFYAGIVYNNLDYQQNKKVMIGWVNNWTYGNQIPTSPWRSAMSIPRELSLINTTKGLVVKQQPISALENLRTKKVGLIQTETFTNAFEFSAEMAEGSTIELYSQDGEKVTLSFVGGKFSFDRTKSITNFHPDFASIDSVPIFNQPSSIQVRVIIDQSIAEIFIRQGEAALTELFFLQKNSIKIKSTGNVKFTNIFYLKSVWNNN